MTKVIDVSDEAEPLPTGYGFSATEPKIAPYAATFEASPIARREGRQIAVDDVPKHGFDLQLVGMAPKRRDPTTGSRIQAFIRKHGAAKLPFGYTEAEELSLIQSFIARHGLTRIPYGAAMTEAGRRWVEPREQHLLRDYKRGVGETKSAGIRPAYRAPDPHLAQADACEGRRSIQSSPMSLRDEKHSRLALAWDDDAKAYRYRKAAPEFQKLPAEGKLAERSCANPECLLLIDEERHEDAMYCPGEYCRKRAAALRTLDKIRKAGQPATTRRTSKISFTSADLYKHPIDITQQFGATGPEVDSPHIYKGVFAKDHLLGRLLIDRAISFEQYEAGILYEHDIATLKFELRAPHRDELDINVWRPREPRIIPHYEPNDLVNATNAALGRHSEWLVEQALTGHVAREDLEKLRTALNTIADKYGNHKLRRLSHGRRNPPDDRRVLHRSL